MFIKRGRKNVRPAAPGSPEDQAERHPEILGDLSAKWGFLTEGEMKSLEGVLTLTAKNFKEIGVLAHCQGTVRGVLERFRKQ